uniref:Uncharacterized protein n=1 Tax=viral metagenome TaxID=1070528 RepID=A0A6M3KZV8_9ZZZZ
MKIKLERTERGFKIGNFKDIYGKECSIQKSSLATDDAIWLGCDEGLHVDGECCARMHLNKELAKEIVRHLNRFIKTGEL